MTKDIKSILITEDALRAKVAQLAARITADYEGKNPLLIGVLKGSFVFMADLMRQITLPCSIDFMAVSSYGKRTTKSTGVVQIIKDLTEDITGRHILIIEDILDSGLTLSYLLEIFKARGVASMAICTLLDKPARRKVAVNVTYSGFSIPDEFVVGYGLDYNENYRNLPYIGILQEHVYTTPK